MKMEQQHIHQILHLKKTNLFYVLFEFKFENHEDKQISTQIKDSI